MFGNLSTDKLNIVLGNVVAGNAGSSIAAATQAEPAAYNALKNGSMGSLGLVGVKVTNLQMTMKGL